MERKQIQSHFPAHPLNTYVSWYTPTNPLPLPYPPPKKKKQQEQLPQHTFLKRGWSSESSHSSLENMHANANGAIETLVHM